MPISELHKAALTALGVETFPGPPLGSLAQVFKNSSWSQTVFASQAPPLELCKQVIPRTSAHSSVKWKIITEAQGYWAPKVNPPGKLIGKSKLEILQSWLSVWHIVCIH